jgi:hypothetical protein
MRIDIPGPTAALGRVFGFHPFSFHSKKLRTRAKARVGPCIDPLAVDFEPLLL